MAAGQGISTFTELTNLARSDVLEVTDVSDTTDSDDGSTRKVKTQTLPGHRLQGNLSGKWYVADQRWYSATGGLGGQSLDTLGWTWFGILDPGEVVSIDGLGCDVATAGSSGSTIRFGLWEYPTSTGSLSLIQDFGTAASTATGAATKTSTAVTLRRALVSVTAQGGSVPSLYAINPVSNQDPTSGLASVTATTHTGLMANQSTTSGALPSTLSWTVIAGYNRWPVLFYKVA